MKYCPQCQQSFSDSVSVCPKDGSQLSDFDVNSLIGKTIDGKYEVQSLLGLGGMGAVFRARHTFINNDVAVKVIHPNLAKNDEIAERFLREARAAAVIDHPNAVKVTDFGRSGDMLYLVMEYIQGYNLTNLIRKKGHLKPGSAANIMSQICAALDDAHAKHIIHRDLKPDNIMIKVDRNKHIVKVFDFGIAKMVIEGKQDNSITRAGTIVGTLSYMSPEQCKGDNVIDLRSDVYSLGVVAFEMLTGALPFSAPTPTALAVKHIVEQPPSLRTIVPEISESVDKVVLRAMQKDPDARFSSAGEFAQELTNAAFSDGEADFDSEFPQFAGPSTGDYNKPKTSIMVPSTTLSAAKIKTGEQSAPPAAKNRLPLYIGLAVALFAAIGLAGFLGLRKMNERLPAPPGSQESVADAPDMVLIKGGYLKMGSFDGYENEQPVHQVLIDDFYMDKTLVTNSQFEKFVNATHYRTDAEKAQEEYDWRTYATSERMDHPVVNISWNDANEYAKWAKKRLPTEAEWEYAARGGMVEKKYPWGDDTPQQKQAAFGHSDDAGSILTGESSLPTEPVKSHDPNGYGLYNMAGNVWEWCQDWYDKSYYFSSPPSNPPGPPKGQARVLRGGSWYTDFTKIRVSTRNSDAQDGRQYDYGFRCAKSK
jgi:serine/threonine-protein kinase